MTTMSLKRRNRPPETTGDEADPFGYVIADYNLMLFIVVLIASGGAIGGSAVRLTEVDLRPGIAAAAASPSAGNEQPTTVQLTIASSDQIAIDGVAAGGATEGGWEILLAAKLQTQTASPPRVLIIPDRWARWQTILITDKRVRQLTSDYQTLGQVPDLETLPPGETP